MRVGVVVDCVGIGRPFREAQLSGAQLPLIERGAERHGNRASDGVGEVEVGGREEPFALIHQLEEIR